MFLFYFISMPSIDLFYYNPPSFLRCTFELINRQRNAKFYYVIETQLIRVEKSYL